MSFVERLQFGFAKTLVIELQTEAAECGLACLSMIASYYGLETDLPTLRQRFSFSLKGATLGRLIEIASAMDMASRPLRLELDELANLQLPCILHWDLNHYVVLSAVRRNQITVYDPAKGIRKFTLHEASESFTGIALELTPSPHFKPRRERQQVSLREMMGRVVGLKRSLMQIFLLAAVLELFSLAAPFYSQWVIDQALVTGDRDLLCTMALGFGMLVLVKVATEIIRGWAVTVMSTALNVQWLANVFKHLVSLPIAYFEKRHLGDIVSRFSSINAIQNTLTTSFVEAILDGILAIGTFAMMWIYSPTLSAIALVAVGIYILLRVSLYSGLRSASQKEIVFAAKQQTIFMETIRGIQSIRLFNKGEERVGKWLNVVVEQKNCNLRTQRLTLIFKTVSHLAFGIEGILAVYLGALAVLDAKFSIGMLLAYISYKEQFTERINSLIDKIYDVAMLRLQSARLADIVLASPERHQKGGTVGIDNISPSIEVRKLKFQYSEGDACVLNNVNLKIEAGESVAIVGPSGCGKTTLLKILLGIQLPTSGEVLIGGLPMRHIGIANYRRMLGVVMQDDQLFAGSIADNICFFAQSPDHLLIQTCAKDAALHEEIMAMPMGYNTLIGDMGAALSGGQKQRILLARALYSKPKILFLDEATSSLDVQNERIINDAIRHLNLTRIIIAHRPETIKSAGRVFELGSANTNDSHVDQRTVINEF